MNVKRQRFVDEFLIFRNATQAAIKAGYSPKSAAITGHRLLSDAKISVEIERRTRDQAERLGATAERVLQELARLAFMDIGALYGAGGKLLPVTDMPEDARRALIGVETEELFEGYDEDRAQVGFAHKVKLADKVRALELLGKKFKLFADRVEVASSDEIVQCLIRGRARITAVG